MRFRTGVTVFLAALGGFVQPAFSQCSESNLFKSDYQVSGAAYSIWMPETSCWNGNFVVFAHGYMAPNRPSGVPEEQLNTLGISLPELLNKLGYGFAASGYSKNGLAILQGYEDTSDLVQSIIKPTFHPSKVYIIGASEGGLVAALSAERLHHVYDAALASCGPVGAFEPQINYFGDFRVLFDYFFPDLGLGDPVSIPQDVIDNWDNVYLPSIQKALADNPDAKMQLINIMQAPVPDDPAVDASDSIIQAIWYQVFATNDATATLGGQPFDNHDRVYTGSQDDTRLNEMVRRFTADPVAVAQMRAHYETSGRPRIPLVTIHTSGDPVVPAWQETLYKEKTRQAGGFFRHTDFLFSGYGHCTFTTSEVFLAFGVMVLQDIGQGIFGRILNILPEQHRGDFLKAMRQHGIRTEVR